MRKRVWLLPLLALLLLGPDWGYVVRTEYRLETADLPEAFSGLRVAVVSDLHGRRLGRNHERLLRALRAAKPDLIAVTGDLNTSSGSLSAAALLLAVYGGYYLATLLSCRRMALSAAHRQREE